MLPSAGEAAIEMADQESRFNTISMARGKGKEKKQQKQQTNNRKKRKMMLLPSHLHVHFSRECDTLSLFSN